MDKILFKNDFIKIYYKNSKFYFNNNEIFDFDLYSFEIIGNYYENLLFFKDKSNLYCNENLIGNYDEIFFKSFELSDLNLIKLKKLKEKNIFSKENNLLISFILNDSWNEIESFKIALLKLITYIDYPLDLFVLEENLNNYFYLKENFSEKSIKFFTENLNNFKSKEKLKDFKYLNLLKKSYMELEILYLNLNDEFKKFDKNKFLKKISDYSIENKNSLNILKKYNLQ